MITVFLCAAAADFAVLDLSAVVVLLVAAYAANGLLSSFIITRILQTQSVVVGGGRQGVRRAKFLSTHYS